MVLVCEGGSYLVDTSRRWDGMDGWMDGWVGNC